MSRRLSVVRVRGRLAMLWPAALVFLLLAGLPPHPALAQSASQPDSVTPVEEFSRQLNELKRTFVELNKRIAASAELRDLVSSLLGAVADNGEVAQLGAKALEHARAKQKSLAADTRYTPEQR